MNTHKQHPLQEYLNANNMTQAQLAKELGVARQYICNVVGGKRASVRLAHQIETLTEGKVPAKLLLLPDGSLPLAMLGRLAA